LSINLLPLILLLLRLILLLLRLILLLLRLILLLLRPLLRSIHLRELKIASYSAWPVVVVERLDRNYRC